MRMARAVVTLPFVVVVVPACSKALSKDRAKALLDATVTPVTCTTEGKVSYDARLGPWGGITSVIGENEQCQTQLAAAHVVKLVADGGGSPFYRWTLVGTDTQLDNDRRLMFRCGIEIISEVSSISTEGKRARVKYIVHTEQAMMSPLAACSLLGLPTADKPKSATLVQDDDGKWSIP